MQYKRFDSTYMLRIDRGEEIMECLTRLCAGEGIRLARVSAIGAVDSAALGVYDLEAQAYRREDLAGFMEIASLSGSVTFMDGKPYLHLHAVLAGQDHAVHGGHVLSLRVGATCEMFVTVMDGEVGRRRDEGLGINLWDLA